MGREEPGQVYYRARVRDRPAVTAPALTVLLADAVCPFAGVVMGAVQADSHMVRWPERHVNLGDTTQWRTGIWRV